MKRSKDRLSRIPERRGFGKWARRPPVAQNRQPPRRGRRNIAKQSFEFCRHKRGADINWCRVLSSKPMIRLNSAHVRKPTLGAVADRNRAPTGSRPPPGSTGWPMFRPRSSGSPTSTTPIIHEGFHALRRHPASARIPFSPLRWARGSWPVLGASLPHPPRSVLNSVWPSETISLEHDFLWSADEQSAFRPI